MPSTSCRGTRHRGRGRQLLAPEDLPPGRELLFPREAVSLLHTTRARHQGGNVPYGMERQCIGRVVPSLVLGWAVGGASHGDHGHRRGSPEEPTVRAELADGDGVPLFEVEGLQPLPRVLVPEMEVPVRSRRSEGAVLVEGDRVHRVHCRLTALLGKKHAVPSAEERQPFPAVPSRARGMVQGWCRDGTGRGWGRNTRGPSWVDAVDEDGSRSSRSPRCFRMQLRVSLPARPSRSHP